MFYFLLRLFNEEESSGGEGLANCPAGGAKEIKGTKGTKEAKGTKGRRRTRRRKGTRGTREENKGRGRREGKGGKGGKGKIGTWRYVSRRRRGTREEIC